MLLVLLSGYVADVGEHIHRAFQSASKKRSVRGDDTFRPRRSWVNKHGNTEKITMNLEEAFFTLTGNVIAIFCLFAFRNLPLFTVHINESDGIRKLKVLIQALDASLRSSAFCDQQKCANFALFSLFGHRVREFVIEREALLYAHFAERGER